MVRLGDRRMTALWGPPIPQLAGGSPKQASFHCFTTTLVVGCPGP